MSADGAGIDISTAIRGALFPEALGAATPAAAGAAALAVEAVARAPPGAALLSLRGDALVAASAVLYSLHVLRLGALAPRLGQAGESLAVFVAGAGLVIFASSFGFPLLLSYAAVAAARV